MPRSAKKKKPDNQASLFVDESKQHIELDTGETSKTQARKVNIPSKVTPRLYGDIGIDELVSRFEALADQYGGEYVPIYELGVGELTFRTAEFKQASEAMDHISTLSFKHQFTCSFRVMMFAKDEFGFRYLVKAKLPGIIQSPTIPQ